jgi:hypothetical protein
MIVILLRSNVILLEIYPKECDTGYSRGTCTPMFIVALFTNNQVMETAKMPHY